MTSCRAGSASRGATRRDMAARTHSHTRSLTRSVDQGEGEGEGEGGSSVGCAANQQR